MNAEGARFQNQESPEGPGLPESEQEVSEPTPPEEILGEKETQPNQPEQDRQVQKAESILSALKTGFTEKAAKDWEGLGKIGERSGALLKKETWKGTFKAIRQNPSLIWKTVVPIIVGIGVAGAAKFWIRQLTGAPGLIVAVSVGASYGGIRSYQAEGAKQKEELQEYKQEIENLKAKADHLLPEQEAALSEKQRYLKAKCAEKWGAAIYGGLRGGAIAGVAYWAAGKIFNQFSQETPLTPTTASEIPMVGSEVSIVPESANFSYGELDSHQALDVALDKPDLENLANTLREGHNNVSLEGIDQDHLALNQPDDMGQTIAEKITDNSLSLDEYLYAHGIDAKPELVEWLQSTFGPAGELAGATEEAQERIMYQVMSHPELLDESNAGLLTNLIENANDPSSMVDILHQNPDIQESHLGHLGRAIDQDMIANKGMAIDAIQQYATDHSITNLNEYHLYPGSDDTRTIQDLISAQAVGGVIPPVAPGLREGSNFDRYWTWLKKICGPVTATALGLLVIYNITKILSSKEWAQAKAETAPVDPSPKEKKAPEFDYKIERLVNTKEIMDFVVSEKFPAESKDTKKQIRSIAHWLSGKRWSKEYTIEHYENDDKKEELYRNWDWEQAEKIFDEIMKMKNQIEGGK